MILFVNVFITDKRMGYYDRGLHGIPRDRLAVFEYMLASFAVIPFEHVYIYVELDDNYIARWPELEKLVATLYPKGKLFKRRIAYQRDWKRELEPILALPGDDLVWFYCNDDQIFVDYELDPLLRVTAALSKINQTEEFCSCFISGFPATFCMLDEPHRTKSYEGCELLSVSDDYYTLRNNYIDSNQIINKRLLEAWWFKNDYGDTFVPRTDWKHTINYPTKFTSIVPLRDMICHHEGYSNCHMHRNSYPNYYIPDGFFAGQIRLTYCSQERRAGYVHINPLIKDYSVVSRQGVDYRWVLEDIPLFWRNRIAETVVVQEIERDVLLKARNEAVITMAHHLCPTMTRAQAIPYLKNFLRSNAEGLTPLYTEGEQFNSTDYVSVSNTWERLNKPELSIVVLDKRPDQANLSLESLDRQSVARENYEVTSVLFTGVFEYRHWVRNLKADTALSVNQSSLWQQGTYNIHNAYNEGALQSRADILVFTDSLTLLPYDFVESVLEKFRADSAGQKIFTLPVTNLASPEAKNGGRQVGFVVSRQLWQELGGIDEDASYKGEAWDLSEFTQRAALNGVLVEDLTLRGLAWQIEPTYAALRIPRPNLTVTWREPLNMNKDLAQSKGKYNQSIPATNAQVNSLLIEGQLQAAIKRAESLVPENSSGTNLVELLTWYRDGRETDRLMQELKTVTESGEQSLTKAILLIALGSLDHSKQRLCEYLRKHPTHYEARRLLILIAQKENNPALTMNLAVDSLRYYPQQKEFLDIVQAAHVQGSM